MDLVIFGDFNCPFSALASARADRLERAGVVRVDWRAVEHDPAIPRAGEPVQGLLVAELDRELEQVHGLLVAGEELALRRPTLRSNTRRAVETYASVDPAHRAATRSELFWAYWIDGDDLGDPRLLDDVSSTRAPETAERWRHEWIELGRPIVPMMCLPDGYVSRGLGALSRLATLQSARDGA
jgi:hypothetical protein